jgi:hypothetical protein
MFNQIFNKKVVLPFFQILGVISIFQWIIFPGLTAADTIVNILSVMIGFFTLLGFYYIVSSWFPKEPNNEEKQMEEEWKQHIQNQMEAMKEMHEQNEALKKKSNPKQFDGVKSDEPFVKTRKKNKSIVKIDFTDAKGMNEIAGVINPIAEGRVKVSVENTKPKPKTKKVK